MARGRMLSKSLSTSEKFASLPRIAGALGEFCQSLYPLIVAHLDDFGRLQGDPFTVKHQCHPTSARSVEEFSEALLALHKSGLIIWYASGGNGGEKKYIQLTGFEDHQVGLHKRTRSKFPRVPESSGNVQDDLLTERFPEIPGQLKGTKENLTKEKRSTDSGVRELIDYYSDGYLQRFGERPHINGGKDGTILKGLLTTAKTLDAVKQRIDGMLDSTDEFITRSGRTIGVLQACWNKLGGPLKATGRGKVQGCNHQPPCVDAAAHTKRELADMKKVAS